MRPSLGESMDLTYIQVPLSSSNPPYFPFKNNSHHTLLTIDRVQVLETLTSSCSWMTSPNPYLSLFINLLPTANATLTSFLLLIQES